MIRQLKRPISMPQSPASQDGHEASIRSGNGQPGTPAVGLRSLRILPDPKAHHPEFPALRPAPKRSLPPFPILPGETSRRMSEPGWEPGLSDCGSGIYRISINSEDQAALSSKTVEGLVRCFQEIKGRRDARVVLVTGGPKVFFSTEKTQTPGQLAGDCAQAIGECELPVIAALEGDALGLGWLLGSLCDLLVCNQAARYGFADTLSGEAARQEWRGFLHERFGSRLASRLLLDAVPLAGSDIARLGIAIPVVPGQEVYRRALELAQDMAPFPRESLALLKLHLGRNLQEECRRFPEVERAPKGPGGGETPGMIPTGLDAGGAPAVSGTAAVLQAAPVEVPIRSDFVRLFAYPDGVLLAELSDPATKNAFSAGLAHGIQELFAQVQSQAEHKVLVLTGHGHFFASGGTKEGLLSIHKGTARYSDAPLYELPLRCEIPVIAAMQGHAIGAGWAFGLFCDQVVFAEEGIYSSRFMRYGFTPGFGSTLIFEHRLGRDLGREILFAARDYTGLELKQRGVPMGVAPHSQVLPLALQQAHHLANSTRGALVSAKQQATRSLKERLPSIIQAELDMHDRTFVRNPGALEGIERHFDLPGSGAKLLPDPEADQLVAQSAGASERTLHALRESLAEELRMAPGEIEPDAPFTDLGLDSITGVSWVRRINKLFGLSVSANEVYQAPTLGEFARLVESRLPRPQPGHPGGGPAAERKGIQSESIAVHSESPKRVLADSLPPLRHPLSEGQKGLWLLQRIDPGMAAYNVPAAFWIRDARWAAALEETMAALLMRHPILGAVMAVDEQGQPYQYLPAAMAIAVQREAIGAFADEAVLAHVKTAFKKPFQLNQDPLLRVQLFTDARDRQVLLITIHHILFDGTSLGVFLRDFTEIWSQVVLKGAAQNASPITPAFFDFIRWEQAYLPSEAGAKDLAYWRQQLSGDLLVAELPADYARPARRTYAGATVSSGFSAPLAQRLRELAKQTRVSLFTLLLAIYKVLLARYVRQETVVVGVPVARRPEERFKEAIGFFVNMVAMKSTAAGALTFTAYLEQIKSLVLEALEHARYPFSKLVSELHIEPGPFHSPLFQTVFVLQNFLPGGGFPGLTQAAMGWEFLPGLHQEGEYDLRLEMVDKGQEMEVCVAYDSDVFNRETMVRFIQHFEVLAECIAEDPGRSLSSYPILSAAEIEQVERGWNQPAQPVPAADCIQDVFEQRMRQCPEAVALVFADGQWTRREVWERIQILAACLQQRGVRPEDRVALCLGRSPGMVISVLGVLYAGAAFVPIDPASPADRIAFLLADSEARLVLADETSAIRLQQASHGAVPVIRIDRDWEQTRSEGDGRFVVREAVAANLAYVIYTSGSTGKPKGVMVEHRQILNTLWHLQAACPVGETDTYLLKTNYTFDVSLAELFGWFVGTGRLAILPPGDERFPDRMAERIQAWGVTHVNFVPPALGVFLNAIPRVSLAHPLGCLKYIMVAGEALPREMAVATACAFPRARVENIYGPTETAIYASAYTCGPQPIPSANTPIGKPIANTQLYVVDPGRRCTGIGMLGELCIAGAGVARGYLNRPELTASCFVDNPFNPGTRLFLTGDLVRWLPDGQIEYFGRIDQQLKIRGFRVEPGEIESVLNQQEGIQTCAVVAAQEGVAKRLVAYYVPKPGWPAIEPQSLIHHLSAVLPDYMVPAFFVPVEAIPLTASGKVNRRELSRREVRSAAKDSKVLPQSTVEERIAAIWKDLLKLDTVSTTDRFFEAGGNSLLAVVLAERISREFNCRFPAAVLFKQSTIQAIARQVAHPEELADAPPVACQAQSCHDRPGKAGMEYPAYYDDSVAIIGISCCFPGASDREQFWRMLCEGRGGGRFLSPAELRQRGVPESLISDPKFVPLSLAIADKDTFDADFFNIPARNALLMDPQFRQLLTHAWRAVEDAGYAPGNIPETSVFMSAGNSFYQRVLDRAGMVEPSDAYAAWVLEQGGTIPAMISYALGLTGPSLFVHSNCSSSLAGLHLACQSLRSGESRYAVVGGATLFYPSRDGYLHRPGLNFSSDGRCKAFDAAADGMVGGEGVAVVVLKRAREALADGDAIYALIRGSALNNDGPEKAGFYSPGVRGQSAVIESVLKSTQVEPESISYLEAHGTGTHLGDPVEVMALSEAYRRHTTRAQFCGLGSVKSNIGHADTAAGLAGCIKVALSLHHRLVPPSINYQTPNPAIDFAGSPFYVADQLKPWEPDKTPRRAALSSFGIGGSNVHAILEECLDAGESPVPPEAAGPCLVPLSAKSRERLREMMENLRHFLSSHDSLPLAGLAGTLSTGRTQMEFRVIFLVQDQAELLQKLQEAATREQSGDGFWMGTPNDAQGDELITQDDVQAIAEKWRSEGKLEKLASLWVRGYTLDWSRLAGVGKFRRLHLPTYPFARDRYSVVPDHPGLQSVAPLPPGWHPLLPENVSTPGELAFETILTGQEFFLADHLVQGRKLLPGVVFLEMVQAAATQLAGSAEPGPVCLRDIVWLRPFYVEAEARTLRTHLRPGAGGRMEVEISAPGIEGESATHCRGAVLKPGAALTAPLDLTELRRGLSGRRWTGSECYRAFVEAGFQYGPAFQVLEELWLGQGQALARLVLPEFLRETKAAYTLHPSLLDAAFQACAVLSMDESLAASGSSSSGPARGLPFALQSVDLFHTCPATGWAWIRLADGGRSESRLHKYDVDICDDGGQVCVRLRGFAARSVEQPVPGPAAQTTLLCRQVWQPEPATPGIPLPEGTRRMVWTCGVAPLSMPAVACHHLHGPGVPNHLGRWFAEVAGRLFLEVQEALRQGAAGGVLFQLVVPVRGPESCLGALSGLFRTAQQENPRFRGQVIEVEPGLTAEEISGLLTLNSRCPGDSLIRHAGPERLLPAWIAAGGPAAPALAAWKEEGVYVITGGAGGIGRLFAREIVTRTRQAKVILVGRSPVSAGDLERWALPVDRVTYHRADLANAKETEELFERIRAAHPVIEGILHGAGIVRDNFILKKSLDEFQAVLAPKVLGTVHLVSVARELRPSFIALFSSGAAWFGRPGQADYATANAFLDRFAGLGAEAAWPPRIFALDWPLWQAGGMRVEEERLPSLKKLGMVPMAAAEGIAAFQLALASPAPQWMVLHGDGERLQALLAAVGQPAPRLPTQNPPAAQVKGLEPQTTEFVRRTISEVTKRPLEKVDLDTPFEKFGIDSILQITIIEKLQEAVGELAKTLLFEHTTLKELVAYLLQNHPDALQRYFGNPVAAESPRPASPPAFSTRELPVSEDTAPGQEAIQGGDIAIIGISGRYPLADSMEEFWDHLLAGRNCITQADARRWPLALAAAIPGNGAPQSAYHGGFLRDLDRFDAALFEVPPERVAALAPETRLLLEVAWETFEDAGYARSALRRHQNQFPSGIGVFLGVMYNQYPWTFASVEQAVMGSNSTEWHLPNRLSHFFDLTGPSLAVNAACSSSLLAIHLACESLTQGSCSMALAGGVNLTLHPSKFGFLQAANLLDAGPASHSFGVGTGYLPGEGAGLVLLKPLRQALQDGDFIHGVIKASHANHAGGRQVYTAPDPNQQARLIAECIRRSGVDPETIGYVESSANGSPLGDPIEILALKKAFRQLTAREGFCALGSVKSNLGHLEAASGISQLSKVILQMKHHRLAPSLHSQPRNPAIQLQGSPFFIQEESAAWPAPVKPGTDQELPRRALIQSIGAGGTCVSLLVEEYPSRPALREPDAGPLPPQLILLSAATAASLEASARRLSRYLVENRSVRLSGVAQALFRREPLSGCRAALVAATVSEAIEKLDQLAAAAAGGAAVGIYRSAENGPGGMGPALEFGEHPLPVLAAHWVAGGGLENLPAGEGIGQGMPALPKYAFDHTRAYGWGQGVEMAAAQPPDDPGAAEGWRVVYRHDEPFLRDHTLGGNQVLIGVAHASLAIDAYFQRFPAEEAVLLQQLAFIKPVEVGVSQQAEVEVRQESSAQPGAFKVRFRLNTDADWQDTASGRLQPSERVFGHQDLAAMKAGCQAVTDLRSLYEAGEPYFQVGPSFRTIQQLFCGTGMALAEVNLAAAIQAQARSYHLHPLLSYSAFSALVPLLAPAGFGHAFLPFGIKSLEFRQANGLERCWILVRLVRHTGEMVFFDADVLAPDGAEIALYRDCSIKRLRRGSGPMPPAVLPQLAGPAPADEEGTWRARHYLLEALGLPQDFTSLDTNLMELGLASARLIELAGRISSDKGIPLDPTLFFEYPTIRELTRYFVEHHREHFSSGDGHAPPPPVAAPIPILAPPVPRDVNRPPPPADDVSREGIAVIGLDGRFAGAANVDQFWANLRTGKDLIVEIPKDHWDYRPWFDENPEQPDKTYCKWGSFIDGVDQFDPAFFNLSADEAGWLDPQVRWLLQSVYSAAENAGVINQLRGSDTGMFAGICSTDYQDRIAALGLPVDPRRTGVGGSDTAANRVSYWFDLQGPSLVFNTACSSSLFALHYACQAIRSGECKMAFVSGVNLLLDSRHYRHFSAIRALSPSGRCRPFDHSADGYVPGECVGTVLLKPLALALRDRDPIHAIIRGSAALHAGHAPSLTAPSVLGQEKVLLKAWADAGLDPRTLSYFECHGTGTKLGDSVELAALKKALARFDVPLQSCAIGSVKGNIGHTEGAAGIASLIKVILQMKHREIPGLPHFQQPNEYLHLDDSPLYIHAQPGPWEPQAMPLRAGVSAFGFSGSYAHVVVEAASATAAVRPLPPAEPETVPIVLSAMNEERLREVARALHQFVQANPSANLADIAYTLQVGRLPMAERLAFVVGSVAELGAKLSAFAAQSLGNPGFLRGRAGSENQAWLKLAADEDMAATIRAWFQKKKYARLLDLWIQGCEIDWQSLHGNTGSVLAGLPSYPFARERCWIPEAADAPGKPGGPALVETRPETPPAGNISPAGEDENTRGLFSSLEPVARAELLVRQTVARQLSCGMDAISPQHTFLELPLGSLGMVDLVQAVGRFLGVVLSPALLFEYPSIAGFAAYLVRQYSRELNQAKGGSAPAGQATLPPLLDSASEVTPLSAGQQGLWALQRGTPGMSAYNCPICFRVGEPLDARHFQQACRCLLQQHPLLASRLEERNGVPVFVPAPVDQFEVQQISACGWPDDQLRSHIRQAIQLPFNLDQELPIRASLLKISDTETVVLITVHHIVFDGSSFPLLMRSLLGAYGCLRSGRQPETASGRGVGYRDYVLAEQKLMGGAEGAGRLAYWKERLAEEPPPMEIPLDYPRSSAQPFVGQTVSLAMASGQAAKLRVFSQDQALYASSVFLAAFHELLKLYSGQADQIIGMPVNERSDDRFRCTIGYFVNLVPIRNRGIGEQPFVELAQAVQRSILAGLANRYPFPALVRELKKSGQGEHPIFQVAFEYQNFLRPGDVGAVNQAMATAFPITWMEGLHQEGEYELALEVIEQEEGGFQLNLKFNPTRLRVHTATRMLSQLVVLLESALENPQRALTAGLLLSPADGVLLQQWNSTSGDYPRDACIHHLFESQARRSPESIALVYGEKTMSYQELDERSMRLACHLQQLGVQPDSVVGLCLERSLEMVVALLGILKAGGAYLPLDPDYPDERLAFMVGDSKTRWILSQSHLAGKVGKIKSPQTQILVLDTDWKKVVGSAKRKPALKREVGARHLAYVLYTSGSTGTPKGVMVEHQALCNRILWMQREYPLDQAGRVLQKTPFSFDVSGWEFHWPLIAGARLILAAPGKHKDPEYLADIIQAQAITVLHFVPSMLQAFLSIGPAGQCQSLKQVFCSGEELIPALAGQFYKRLPQAWLHNLYGPTEAAIDVTYTTCAREAAKVVIGKPISNVQIHIVDSQLRLLPIGFPGELCIAGDALARGYLNLPSLTADRFVENPFAQGTRLYRTGDLARWTSEGEIEFLGRLDQQVKIRGCRIELGEIETAMAGLEGIREVVVVAQADPDDRQLVAYYVSSGAALDQQRLRAQLRQTLPEHMIPSGFVQLDHLPLTASGKVDRRQLSQKPAALRPEVSGSQPRTETQARLAGLWCAALSLKTVGIYESFFDLGGHSLSALTLMAKVNATFNARLPVATLLEVKCIAGLADRLDHRDADERSPLIALAPQGTRLPIFLVPGSGDSGFSFMPLSCALGPDQPVFLFPPPGLREPRATPATIEEMAAHYIGQLPPLAGAAGYCLGGWSMGGVVAYEMACQMAGQGIPVERLILLDSYLPEHFEAFSRAVGEGDGASTSGIHPFKAMARGDSLGGNPEVGLLAAQQQALARYRASRVHPGEVVYFYATENVPVAAGGLGVALPSVAARLQEVTCAVWSRYLPRIAARFVAVPGSHESMMREPSVHFIASEILAFCGPVVVNSGEPVHPPSKRG